MDGVILQDILDGNSEMDELFGKEKCEKFRKDFALYEEKMKECEEFLKNPKYTQYWEQAEKVEYAERIANKFMPCWK